MLTKQTKIDIFLNNAGITPIELSRESGYSRQYLLRVRRGANPSERCKRAIIAACRRLSHTPVREDDLF